MDNTTYEFFICRCWNCIRFQHGANTDTWEDLLVRHWEFKHSGPGNEVSLEKDYLKKLGVIKNYLNKAFDKLISNAKKKKINQVVLQDLIDRKAIVETSLEPQEIFDTLKSSFAVMNANGL